MPRSALFAALTAFGLLGQAALAVEPVVGKFFKTHCVECHGAETQESGLRLDSLATEFTAPAAFATWVKIHDRLRAGEMPPKESAQPSTADRRAVVEWLGKELTAADLALRKTAGRSPVRRLNRTEYENTLRDLFELPGLPVRDLLPEDGRAYGYDKSGDGLELSHVQLSKYMELADLALDAATATQIEAPDADLTRVYPTQRNGFKKELSNGEAVLIKDLKVDDESILVPGRKLSSKAKRTLLKGIMKDLDDYQGSVGLLKSPSGEFNDFTIPSTGMYRVQLSCWSFAWDGGNLLPTKKPHVLQLRAGPKARERSLGYFDVESMKPTTVETVAWLFAGEQIGFYIPTMRLDGPRKGSKSLGQGMAIDWLKVDGPQYDRWPAQTHRRLFGELPLLTLAPNSPLRVPDHSLSRELGVLRGKSRANAKRLDPWAVVSSHPKEDAARLLGEFLPRAFRRPVTSDELAPYVAIVEQMVSENLTFEDALRWAYKTALCSTEFLFFAEPPGKLNDLALASRLSYFLWNSMPDEKLIAVAASGKLHEPAVLREQVDRMLADAKSERFVSDFTDQWLDLKEIDATMPDRKLYPEFSAYLRDSMLSETQMFFRELLDRDLSVMNIVDSDFAMLNQRLAEHYGIPGVEGSKLRLVKLPPGCHRGGLLTQGAVLKVTANGTTTTPVKRGSWVMREIVGLPPAPPPPNIPSIEPDVRGTTTIREQLDKHRSDQVCASCHAKMDPPGFALESFDVIGGWRTRYRSMEKGEPTAYADGRQVDYLLGPSVDSAGQLTDGRKFADVDEYKQLLKSNSEQIGRNVIEQLLTYATGSEISFADRQVVEEILGRTRAGNYGLRTMIHEVVQSRLFLEK